ncbi:Arabinogalactan peptide [Vigna unguiculata]|uniref:Arabinogalactan peptide n=1 Tax=Vigna unguiculata TaxID=3917 RepID=A0A4D6LU51_VIGUN|nr:Arabinogalactan peptide [Vigna unguiculata]
MKTLNFVAFPLLTLLFIAISHLGHAQDLPSPAPSPTSDGTTIDQGIAYILMLVALGITYMIH